MILSPKKRFKRWQERALDDAFEMHGGYVLDFNDRTMAEWFDVELSLDLEQQKYCRIGRSRAKRLREFVLIEPPALVGKVLRRLWRYRVEETPFVKGDTEEERRIEQKLFEFIAELEGDTAMQPIDILEDFDASQTLGELIKAITRDLDAGSPAAAMDRLHTYCMKRFAFLLQARGASCTREEPLHSRAGKYFKLLEGSGLSDRTTRMLKGSIGTFERFNAIRNNQSFAHDNEILDQAEARFVLETVAATLRFIRDVDGRNFEGPSVVARNEDTGPKWSDDLAKFGGL